MGTRPIYSGTASFTNNSGRFGSVSAIFLEIKKMLVLITYDVNTTTAAGRKRLTKIAKECVNYGQRVQNSVFECDLDAASLVTVRKRLLDIINEKEDSLRIYNLGNKYANRIEHYGTKESYDPEGELIF